MCFSARKRHYKTVLKSKKFDADWYLSTYTDVATSGVDAVSHYLDCGWRYGYNPGPEFNTNAYLRNYPDVRAYGRCPLLHWEHIGARRGYECCNYIQTLSEFEQEMQKKYIMRERVAAQNVSFSIIMPTFNRADIICRAIDSVLSQTYKNFELIIVDDGSTDGTAELIAERYKDEISNGMVRYIYQDNAGVCCARNTGLAHAIKDWIAYLDSDNILFDCFLETFVRHIDKGTHRCMYAQRILYNNGMIDGRSFDLQKLLRGNYIDLGVFVHRHDLYKELGGFDENLTRLVDWDLIIKYARQYRPLYISQPVFLYNNLNDHVRISNSANYEKNYSYIRAKYSDK